MKNVLQRIRVSFARPKFSDPGLVIALVAAIALLVFSIRPAANAQMSYEPESETCISTQTIFCDDSSPSEDITAHEFSLISEFDTIKKRAKILTNEWFSQHVHPPKSLLQRIAAWQKDASILKDKLEGNTLSPGIRYRESGESGDAASKAIAKLTWLQIALQKTSDRCAVNAVQDYLDASSVAEGTIAVVNQVTWETASMDYAAIEYANKAKSAKEVCGTSRKMDRHVVVRAISKPSHNSQPTKYYAIQVQSTSTPLPLISSTPSSAPTPFLAMNLVHRPLDTPSGVVLDLEIADTPEKQNIGLMGRSILPSEHGIAFIYPVDQNLSFWMKEVPFPLDFMFVQQNGRITAIEALQGSLKGTAESEIPRTTGYGSIVIAIPEGEALDAGFQIGSIIPHITEKFR